MSTVPHSRAARLPSPSGPVVLLVVGLVASAALAGAAVSRNGALAVLATTGLVLAVVAAQQPVMLAAVALGTSFAAPRIFGASAPAGTRGGISYSDLLLTAAFMCALPAVTGSPEVARLRPAIRGLVVYLLALLPTVILHRYSANYLEWLHRLVLVGGSLTVGAWIAREKRTTQALRLLLAGTVVFSVAAVIYELTNDFAPAFPLGQQKNFVGSMLSLTLVIIVAAPRAFGLSTPALTTAGLTTAAGLLSTQSRGGMLGAVFALIVVFARHDGRRSRPRIVAAVIVGAAFATFATISIRHELSQTSIEVQNSSIGERFSIEKAQRAIWRSSPITGAGLKYFFTDREGPEASPANNAIDNELAESGIVGLAGFVLMQGGAIVAVGRRRDPLAVAALGVLLDRLLHGMVDIYWTAGDSSLPFIITGIALATVPGARAEPRDSTARATAALTR